MFWMLLLSACSVAFGQVPGTDSRTQVIDGLIAQAREKNLAEERYWHLLLHYRPRLIGGVKSEVDGEEFFLSANGKTDPEAELEATIRSFFAPAPDDPEIQHPQCRFPARLAWLRAQLGFGPGELEVQPCERFSTWRSKLNPGSVTVIFADAYLDNPASMYGHTFLRLNNRAHGPGERLLDYTVNFLADTDTKSGITFAILGLTGGYPGRFSAMPFYGKVQEYNNIESRDLWEYRLSLDQEAVDRLVMHLWELWDTHFDYYFLDENCSYQLLPLLEVADPSLHLTDSVRPWVIPIDTIRILLSQKGLVVGIERRPSLLHTMIHLRSSLSSDEVAVAATVSKTPDDETLRQLDRYPKDRQAVILDTAYAYYRYRIGYSRDESRESKELERRLLLSRNQLGLQTPELRVMEEPVPPHDAHKTGQIGFSTGASRQSTFEELSLRPALHDLGADQAGYIPHSELEMFHLRVRYDNRYDKLFIEEMTLLKIISLSPLDSWVRKFSWRFKLGADSAKELDCRFWRCLYYGLEGGRGLSAETHLWRDEVFYLFAEIELDAGGVFRHDYRLGAGGRAGLLLDMSPYWSAQFEGAVDRFPLGNIQTRWEARMTQVIHVSRILDFRLTLQALSSYREGLWTINYYL